MAGFVPTLKFDTSLFESDVNKLTKKFDRFIKTLKPLQRKELEEINVFIERAVATNFDQNIQTIKNTATTRKIKKAMADKGTLVERAADGGKKKVKYTKPGYMTGFLSSIMHKHFPIGSTQYMLRLVTNNELVWGINLEDFIREYPEALFDGRIIAINKRGKALIQLSAGDVQFILKRLAEIHYIKGFNLAFQEQ